MYDTPNNINPIALIRRLSSFLISHVDRPECHRCDAYSAKGFYSIFHAVRSLSCFTQNKEITTKLYKNPSTGFFI